MSLTECSPEKLESFLENASVNIHTINLEGIILWANSSILELLGYDESDYIGKHISEFHVDEHVINDMLNQVTQNQILKNYYARMKCKDGSTKNVHINSNLRKENGKIISIRLFIRDMTTVMIKQEESRQQLLALKKENEKVNELSYILSHHMKEPLRVIRNKNDLVLNLVQDQPGINISKEIDTSNKCLTKLESLLDTIQTYLNPEHEEVTFNSVNLNTLLDDCQSGLKEKIQEKNATIRVQPDLPSIIGCHDMLLDLFNHLISNALNFKQKHQP